MPLKQSKSKKDIFVIMPFTGSPTRKKEQLTAFFEFLKKEIENEELQFKYNVFRSGEDFNITDQIIKDLYSSDIVIADLSGELPNANVMYELGVRLAISEKPVILIREKNIKNLQVFDIQTYYTYPYDPLNLPELFKHIIEKLKRFETGEEKFVSPVFKIIPKDMAAIQALQTQLSIQQQKEYVLKGASIIWNDVSAAFGPQGGGLSMQEEHGSVFLAKQGIKISSAKRNLSPLENQGAILMNEVANDMHEKFGDGSKTAIIIAFSIMNYIQQHIKKEHLITKVISGMKKAIETAISNIKKNTNMVVVDDSDILIKIARIAAKNDFIYEELNNVINKAKEGGVITIESGSTDKTSIETISNFQFDRGYISPQFNIEHSEEILLEGCYILLYTGKIGSKEDLLIFLEKVVQLKKPLLIIANEIEDTILQILIHNNSKKIINCVAVKSPLHLYSTTSYNDFFKDIAVFTGAKIIGFEKRISLNEVEISDLGKAERVTVNHEQTRIFCGKGDNSEIIKYTEWLLKNSASVNNLYKKEKIIERVGMLKGRLSIIKVGGRNSQEINNNKYYFESALKSFRAVIEDGFVPGGGISFLNARTGVKKLETSDSAESLGINAVLNALEQPLNALARNSNLDESDVLTRIENLPSSGFGLNAKSNVIENLYESGILDPTSVICGTLDIAFSHAKKFVETSTWLLKD